MKGELGNLNIEIIPNKENKTLTIRDRGIGMDEEEVNKYLNQVAFSSAQEFLDKYKDELNIIGHFGLGFYSAFMVAEKVEVITKSYKSDSVAVRWTCNGETEYTIQPDEKSDRGTDIVLHLSTDAQEYLEEFKLQTLLDKFCKFLPVPIQLGTKKETIREGRKIKRLKFLTSSTIPTRSGKNHLQKLQKKNTKLFMKSCIHFPESLYFGFI